MKRLTIYNLYIFCIMDVLVLLKYLGADFKACHKWTWRASYDSTALLTSYGRCVNRGTHPAHLWSWIPPDTRHRVAVILDKTASVSDSSFYMRHAVSTISQADRSLFWFQPHARCCKGVGFMLLNNTFMFEFP